MSDQRDGGISWCDETWGVARGCSRVDADCGHLPSPAGCYAEATARRFSGPGLAYEGLVRISKKSGKPIGWNGQIRLVEHVLYNPIRWARPRKIFPNSMSDLFHENMPTEAIDRVMAVMLLTPRHTYQALTKRSARMLAYLSDDGLYERVLRAADVVRRANPKKRLDTIAISDPKRFPPSWIWWGVSCGHQAALDARIADLIRVPAAVRWVSQEPQWEPMRYRPEWLTAIQWVVQGGESGPRARPFHTSWATHTRDQCLARSVAYYLKQLGANVVTRNDDNFTIAEDPPDPAFPSWPGSLLEEDRIEPIGPQHQGAPVRLRLRDHGHGAEIAEYRTDLRVRQFPGGAT